ncbi:MAG: Uma2 family endonuclease [Acidimicrobiales bacterium]
MTVEPVQHTHPLLDHRGPWSEADYLALPEVEGTRIDLVDGDLVLSPSPDNAHQRLVALLLFELHRQVPDGYEALPGGNVRLASGRINIPDVLVVTLADRIVNDAADVPLVAEIVSDSGRFRDRILKPVLYAEAGIPWYIRVEPRPRVELVLHRLEKGRYVEQGRAHEGQRVEIPELGITIEVDALVPRR